MTSHSAPDRLNWLPCSRPLKRLELNGTSSRMNLRRRKPKFRQACDSWSKYDFEDELGLSLGRLLLLSPSKWGMSVPARRSRDQGGRERCSSNAGCKPALVQPRARTGNALLPQTAKSPGNR